MISVPAGQNYFAWQVTSHGNTTRPALAMGPALTPGNNTKGSYTQLFSALANDAYGILIQFNNNSRSSAGRNSLVDVGIDAAGGSSYSVLIPDLINSGAVDAGKGGIYYYFPLFIKAGATLGVRGSVNDATVQTINVLATVFGQPKNPEMCKTGSFVTAYGVTAASSSGTGVTSGTTSEGSWTSLGTSSADHWWWQQGLGCDNNAMSAIMYACDLGLGDATNKDVVILDQIWGSDTSERMVNFLPFGGCERFAPSGTKVYGRIQCSGTPNTPLSMIAYGMG